MQPTAQAVGKRGKPTSLSGRRKTRTLVRLQASPTMGRKSEAMQSQLQCSLDFAFNSFKLKDLAHSQNLTLVFSIFCSTTGGRGGTRY